MGKKSGTGFYAVQQGRNTGVYSSWAEAKAQVDGYSGAVFKRFDSSSSAQDFASVGSTTSTSSSRDWDYGGVGPSRSGPLYSNESFYSMPAAVSQPSRSMSTKATPPPTPTPSSSNSKSRKFYAVAKGHSQGIFNDWESCKSQVNGFEGAKFKKFDTKAEAEAYVASNQPASRALIDGTTSGYASSGYDSASASAKSKGHYYAANFSDGTSQIYDDWDTTRAAVHGKQGVTYKKFVTLDSAKKFTATAKVTHSQTDRDLFTQRFLENNTRAVLEEQRKMPATVVYTDGSFFNERNAGVGVYFGPDDVRNVCDPVSDVTDSYGPEVRALDRAMDTISREIDSYESGEGSTFPKYVISSDNEAAKNVMTQYGKHWSKDEFLKRKDGELLYDMTKKYEKIQDFYSRNHDVFNGHEFDIRWVKGHAGIDGNEQADKLAKEGAMKRNG